MLKPHQDQKPPLASSSIQSHSPLKQINNNVVRQLHYDNQPQKESRNEVINQQHHMKESESFVNLIQSNVLNNNIELCEVFVLIGAHPKTLENALRQRNCDEAGDSLFIDHNCDEISIGRPSNAKLTNSEHLMKCNAQILDSYPLILRDKSQKEFQPILKNDPQISMTTNIIDEKYLYLGNIQIELNLIEYSEGSINEKKLIFVPKAICFVSRLPIFSIQKQMLEFLYEDIIKKYHKAFADQYSDSDNFIEIEQNLQKAKEQTKYDRLEFYLSVFFHHLRIDGSNLEIEIYKKLSMADEMTPGSHINQQKKTIIRYINTFNKECLRLENYEFKLLFQKIRPKMLLQMFVSLLHERKIILIHNEISRNAILIEALISLLYPLQWNFTNISYLIPSMVEYLEAPFPYIVGVPRELWKYIYENKWDILGEEVVAFDIDNQRVYEKEPLPEFPQPYTQLLIKQLEIQLEKSKQFSQKSNQRESNTETLKEEVKFWNNFTLKVKQQFLNFLIFLINTFENFYIYSHESPMKLQFQTIGEKGTAASTIDSNSVPYFPGGGHHGSANDIFNFDEYVQNVRENQSFFKQFVRTQAFINFIEQAFFEEQGNLSDASIRFFKECTRKLSKENIQTVRAMQDTIIQRLIHKFNNRGISYSIDKCYLIYEKNLRLQNQSLQPRSDPAKSYHGLISSLDHAKIITLTPFDPKLLIEKQYKMGVESIHGVQNFNQKSNKKPQQYYQDIMKELQIDEVPSDYNSLGQTGQMQDYYTLQVTPNGIHKIMVEFQDQDIGQEQLNKTTALIKIEDNTDEASNQSQPQNKHLSSQIDEHSNEASSDYNDQEPGFFGFFKKTFSSVKKTFESTFNQNQLQSKSQTRKNNQEQRQEVIGSSHMSLRRKGANTPALENPSKLEVNDQGQKQFQTKEKLQNVGRTTRSQTFHVKSSNPAEEQKPIIQCRDRKNNNSFFANLLNLGSNSKNDRNQSIENSLSPNQEEIKNQTLDFRAKKRLMNGSGFFVFNEEDMKSMTEMSPKQTFRQKSTLLNINRSLNQDSLQIDNQLSNRQVPIIKVSPPTLDNFQTQNLINRMRSISYQNQSKHQTLSGNGVQPSLKLMHLLNESLSNSQIIEETPQSYSTKEQNSKSNRITFAANTESIMSPIPRHSEQREANITASEKTNASQHLKINMNLDLRAKGVRSFRQTPNQSNMASAFKDKEGKFGTEFEEIYLKSTKNLFFVPPEKLQELDIKEKSGLWQSQTGKINLLGSQSSISAPPKPPKHQANNSHNKKQLAIQIKQNTTHQVSKQAISPKPIKIQTQSFEDKLILQKSISSDIYNEKNSTDEEVKAPILGKNLKQFKNMMKQNQPKAPHFDKHVNQSMSSIPGGQKKSSQSNSVMKTHKRQISSGLQSLRIKGETSHLAVNNPQPLLENIDPEDDKSSNQNLVMQIESLQIGRVRKKSSSKNTSKGNNAQVKKTVLSYKKQQTTLHQKIQNQRPSQIKVGSDKKQKQGLINSNVFVKNSVKEGASIKDQIVDSIVKNSGNKHNSIQYNNQKISQSNQYDSSQISSSYQSKTSLINSSFQNDSIALVNSSKIEVSKHIRKLDESSMPPQHDDTSQSLDNLNYFSNHSQSEVQNTQSYINAVNSSQIDLRDSKKGDFLRLKSQAVVNSPVNLNSSSSHSRFNLTKYTPKASQEQNSKNPHVHRLHSLSQYQQNEQSHQALSNNSGQRAQMFSRMQLKEQQIQSFSEAKKQEDDGQFRINSYRGPTGGGGHGPQFNQNNGPRNNMKPLNKITFEQFNQIAKLSGDVDHEPHTPKSAGIGSDEDVD